jgi:hypothetical protein
VPAISRFFGIVISMYYDDHLPAHFHARYTEYRAKIAIESLEVTDGKLPRRALALILEWAQMHKQELQHNWQQARDGLPLNEISPLE